jgi:Dna[CI] antecedent, DciA
MESLQQTSTRVLQRLLAAQPTTPGKVLFAWRIAAGPALGRAGTPTWSEEGTLRVHARDATWLREMRHARPIIVERLTALLGAGVVRKLELE